MRHFGSLLLVVAASPANSDRPSGPLCCWNPNAEALQQLSWESSNLTVPSGETAGSAWASSTHVRQDTPSLLLPSPATSHHFVLWVWPWTDGPYYLSQYFIHPQAAHTFLWWPAIGSEGVPCCPLPLPHALASSPRSLVLLFKEGTGGKINKSTADTQVQAGNETLVSVFF